MLDCTRCGGKMALTPLPSPRGRGEDRPESWHGLERAHVCGACGWAVPAFVAGMAQDVVQFMETQFVIRDENDGNPRLIRLEGFQREVLWSLFPPRNGGNPVAIDALFSQPKKQGKTTLAAGIMLYMVTRRKGAEGYLLANSRDQAKAVVFDKIKYSLNYHPYWRQHANVPERGSTIEFPSLGSFIRALPQRNWGALEGVNPDCVLVDEAAAFMGDAAQNAFDALVVSPQKAGRAVRLITSYAGFRGQSKLLENYWRKGLEGALQHGELPIRYTDWAALWSFVDQGPDAWRMPWMEGAGFEQWLASIRSDTSPSAYLRFALNEWAASEERFVAVETWDALAEQDVKLKGPQEETRVFVAAVDAATKRDCTALVVASYNDALERVEIVYCRVWVPDSGPLDLVETVGAEVLSLHQRYPGRLITVGYDPFQMAAVASQLTKAGVPMEEFTQTNERTRADTHLLDLIRGGRLAHYGDETLREHMRNAIASETAKGTRIVKEKGTLKVDAAVATSMAALLAVDRIGFDDEIVVGPNPFFGTASSYQLSAFS